MVLSLLRKRRSIRQFKPQPIEAEKVEALIEAALRSPSSRGRNPWQFVVVDDTETLGRLARAKAHGSEFLAGAPLAVVVCADPQRCDVWVEDCAIAAILLQLAAESLELGSCWVQIRQRPHGDGRSAEAYVREMLGLPETLVVACIVGIGYPVRRPPGHPRASLSFDRVHRNRFGGLP
jgi:nitroreductase